MKALEIEIDGQHNENLHFRPLQRSIRGRFDFNRVAEPMARLKAGDWPTPIPSQRLGVDREGVGYLVEPLHDDKHAATREKIKKRGMELEPKLQVFENIDLPTWYFWLKRAVESGIAKIVSGKLPDRIDGEPRKNFILNEPEQSATDKLTAAIEKQTAMFAKLLEKLA